MPVGHHLLDESGCTHYKCDGLQGVLVLKKITHYSQQPVSYGVCMRSVDYFLQYQSAKQHFKSIYGAKDSEKRQREGCSTADVRTDRIQNTGSQLVLLFYFTLGIKLHSNIEPNNIDVLILILLIRTILPFKILG